MNTYLKLKYKPPATQFLVFLGIAAGFFLLGVVISSFFFTDINRVLLNKDATITPDLISKFKWDQLLTSTVSFIIPAFLFGYFSSPKSLPYIGIQKTVAPQLLIASILLLFAIQPFIGWLGEMNARINFGSMQKSLEQMEAMYNRALQVFLKMNNFGDMVINLFIMALLPAIGEELFFRGSLQKVLLRITNKPWVAIVISSTVFALLHGTFFKLLPIFTLGLLLGTVYYVTRNLWYTIIIHFLNNALAVVSVYYANSSGILKKLSNDDIAVPLFAAIISLAIAVGIIYYLSKKSDLVFPKFMTNDDNDFIAS